METDEQINFANTTFKINIQRKKMHVDFISSPSGILIWLANAIAVLIDQPDAANHSPHLTLIKIKHSRDQRVISSIDNEEAGTERALHNSVTHFTRLMTPWSTVQQRPLASGCLNYTVTVKNSASKGIWRLTFDFKPWNVYDWYRLTSTSQQLVKNSK